MRRAAFSDSVGKTHVPSAPRERPDGNHGGPVQRAVDVGKQFARLRRLVPQRRFQLLGINGQHKQARGWQRQACWLPGPPGGAGAMDEALGRPGSRPIVRPGRLPGLREWSGGRSRPRTAPSREGTPGAVPSREIPGGGRRLGEGDGSDRRIGCYHILPLPVCAWKKCRNLCGMWLRWGRCAGRRVGIGVQGCSPLPVQPVNAPALGLRDFPVEPGFARVRRQDPGTTIGLGRLADRPRVVQGERFEWLPGRK